MAVQSTHTSAYSPQTVLGRGLSSLTKSLIHAQLTLSCVRETWGQVTRLIPLCSEHAPLGFHEKGAERTRTSDGSTAYCTIQAYIYHTHTHRHKHKS